MSEAQRRSPVSALLALPLLLLLGVPVVMLIMRASPGAIATELRDRETLSAIGLSLASSSVALVVSVVLGVPLAYWLARTRGHAGIIAETLVDLPTVLPPSVAGIALLLTFGRMGVLGGAMRWAGIDIAFTSAAVVVAQVFVASPYFVRAARAGFASVGSDLREAALMDGATGWRLVRHVLVPQAGPALAGGAAMCWGRAIGEFGATIIFAGNFPGRTQTMPLAVYLGLENNLDRALVLSTLLIAISVLVLLGVRMSGWRPVR
jgi:molybdate transport system permease protein